MSVYGTLNPKFQSDTKGVTDVVSPFLFKKEIKVMIYATFHHT